jgi:hypothetical protein
MTPKVLQEIKKTNLCIGNLVRIDEYHLYSIYRGQHQLILKFLTKVIKHQIDLMVLFCNSSIMTGLNIQNDLVIIVNLESS